MLSVGTLLRNRYRIDRMLEISASGGLYRAWDTQANVAVVVRELLPQPDLSAQALATLRQRFEQEAQALLDLHHPHLVEVLDFFCERVDNGDLSVAGRDDPPSAYVVTEFVEGERLIDRVRQEGPPPEERANAWAAQLLNALDYCHRHGVLHKDVRPENVLIRVDGKAMLANYGLTGLWQPSDPRKWAATQVLGTPEYASPEQWQQQVSQIDVCSDIYGLGATLYFALSGSAPPTAADRTANPYRFMPLKGLGSRVGGHTQRVVMRAMALPRDKRYPDARSMLLALQTPSTGVQAEARPAPLILERRRIRTPLVRIVGILFSAIVIVVVGLATVLLRPTPPSLPTVTPQRVPATQVIELGPGAPDELQPTGSAPTVTPTRRPTPTATPEAALDIAVTRTLTWTTVLDDPFDLNAHAWLDSTGEDDWGRVTRAIEGGEYIWQIEAFSSVGRWCTPDMPLLGTVYASVDAQRQSGPLNTAYGLVLRHVSGSYHVFSVRDDGYFRFSSWYGSDWQAEIDWTATLALKPGEANQLVVIAEGNRFELYVNGSYLDTATSDLLASGEVGLTVELAEPGEATIVFDNFRVRSPEEVVVAEETPGAPTISAPEAVPEA